MSEQSNDPRVPLAAERTLLAWIRTSLAMMGFGFVVARFGLFLREIEAASYVEHSARTVGMSLWIGTGLVVLGAATALLAGRQYLRFLDLTERGETFRPGRWSLGVVVALLIAFIGAFMAGYLLLMRG